MSTVDQLRSVLAELEIDAATLRRDRSGGSWLPPSAKLLCERDAECADELRRFVADELELYGSADVGHDPFFTARIVAELPAPVRWTGLSPRRRLAILAAFHLVGVSIAAAVLAWASPRALAIAAETAHGWLDGAGLGHDAVAGGPIVLSAIVVVVGLIAFASTRPHTPVA